MRLFLLVGMYLDLMSQPTLSQAQESTPVLSSSNSAAAELRPSPGLTPLRSEAPDLAASSRQKGWSSSERIEWFTEGQAFFRLHGHPLPLPPHPPVPVSKLSPFLSHPVCRWSSLLERGGRGWTSSRIIRPQESLALYKYWIRYLLYNVLQSLVAVNVYLLIFII